MEEKRTIFSYLSQILGVFGFSILCMTAFTFLFGNSAWEISALFRLGSEGIPLEITLEFFVLSIIITLLQYLFFTDKWIKKMPLRVRVVCMMICILAAVSAFILLFEWFPADMWEPWVMFLLCFAVCSLSSTAISFLKTRAENEKLQEGLEKLKKQWEDENERAD